MLSNNRILSRRNNNENQLSDISYSIGGGKKGYKLWSFFHFELEYSFSDRYRKIGECQATAQEYPRLLNIFQTTCFVHICWIIFCMVEGCQNTWKLRQTLCLTPCYCFAWGLACHVLHKMDTYSRVCDDCFDWQSSTSNKISGHLSKVHDYPLDLYWTKLLNRNSIFFHIS